MQKIFYQLEIFKPIVQSLQSTKITAYIFDSLLNLKHNIMAKSSGLKNAPSTTGRPSGSGRGNNPPRTTSGKTGSTISKGKR